MRALALIALVLVCAAAPVSAQSIGTAKTYTTAPNSTPGEPSCAVLVMTGLGGIALVGLKKRSTEE